MSGYPNANSLGAAVLTERPDWLLQIVGRFSERYVADTETGCWNWLGGTDKRGYGRFGIMRDGVRRSFAAHRFSLEITSGAPLPSDQVVDHLCRNHRCVNPDHLEAVKQVVNIRRGLTGQHNARKTHCPYGHEYTADNTYVIPKTNGRTCRTCAERRHLIYQQKLRAG